MINGKKITNFLISRFGNTTGTVLSEIIKSFITALWFMFLTFPLVVIKVNTIDNIINWRWHNMLIIGVAFFILSYFWRFLLKRKEIQAAKSFDSADSSGSFALRLSHFQKSKLYYPSLGLIGLLMTLFPLIASLYQTNVVSSALIYVMLGLGLNIVVGLGGLLNLGYVAFYMVGAYTYALLNHYFGVSFWIALPLGALTSTIFGLLLALPILRLRGDYLAIVTLAFAEIMRLVMQNWSKVTGGPTGIEGISRPDFFMKLKLPAMSIYIYYIILAMTILTIFAIYRLENSRIGRALQALREDEIASSAMGIDTGKMKLISFSLGATWAGFGGVLFAAKTTFINPDSFTIWESIIILLFVVLGGMGSIFGVAVAAVVLTILPESLRAFANYRMFIYGIILVLMMVFRPGGIIDIKKKHYKFKRNEQ